jgi:tetratricopeptide (TPR) repeat protein
MSTKAVREFATTTRQNTDDHPLLEFYAPRQLFTDTGELNIALLYEAKDGLLPPGTEGDLEQIYGGMMEPFLSMNRVSLAGQVMAVLGQVERKEPGSLPLVVARMNIDSVDLDTAEESLKQADGFISRESALYAEKEEVWGLLYDHRDNTLEAKKHYRLAAEAGPARPLPLRRLAEISADEEAWAEAAGWMERFIATEPVSLGRHWAMLATYRFAANQSTEGLEALETALQIDPYLFTAHYQMARLFEDRNDTENAIREYEFLVRYAYDRDPDVYIKLANLYIESGRMRDAERVLAKGVRILPTDAGIYRLHRELTFN